MDTHGAVTNQRGGLSRGFSYLPESKWLRIGRLTLSDDTLMLDRVQDNQMRNLAALELCRTRAIDAIEITSEQVAKSKLGAVLLFGVLGGGDSEGVDGPSDDDRLSQEWR